MDDEPVNKRNKALRKMERRAMYAYRAKYPDGKLWQDLPGETRSIWMAWAEQIPADYVMACNAA